MSRDFVGALLQLNAEKQVSARAADPTRSRTASSPPIAASPATRTSTSGSTPTPARSASSARGSPSTRSRTRSSSSPSTRPASYKADAQPGELVETEELPDDVFGRIGAQTAKQVVLQRLREVERDQVFDKFANREGEMITGAVNRVEPRAIILDVGNNVEAVLATTEQSPVEHYRIGQNVKAYVLEVRRSSRGPADPRQPDAQGLPEAPLRARGARDPQRHGRDQGDRPRGRLALEGRRRVAPGRASIRSAPRSASAARASRRSSPSSAARRSTSSRGTTTPSVFVANALSPAQVLGVDIDEEHRIANVTVPERMLSLAIGREGQNARLAARLTGWRIDIRSDVSVAEAKAAADEAAEPAPRQPSGRGRRRGAGRGRAGATEPRRRRPRRPRPTAAAEAAAAKKPTRDEGVAAASNGAEAAGRARPPAEAARRRAPKKAVDRRRRTSDEAAAAAARSNGTAAGRRRRRRPRSPRRRPATRKVAAEEVAS